MFAYLAKFAMQQDHPAKQQCGKQHEDKCRKDAPYAPHIEIGNAELARFQLLEDDQGDQVAGNDKEDVDADEAADEPVWPSMMQDDCKHGYSAQTVDVGPV
ncbi:hypothetical protein D3C81_1978540 [compost metagenome]